MTLPAAPQHLVTTPSRSQQRHDHGAETIICLAHTVGNMIMPRAHDTRWSTYQLTNLEAVRRIPRSTRDAPPNATSRDTCYRRC